MARVPTGSAVVVKIATPPLRAAEPSVVEPSRNVTEPSGAPAPGATTATVAVRVIGPGSPQARDLVVAGRVEQADRGRTIVSAEAVVEVDGRQLVEGLEGLGRPDAVQEGLPGGRAPLVDQREQAGPARRPEAGALP